MKRTKLLATIGAAVGGLLLATSVSGDDDRGFGPDWRNRPRCEVTKSLFVNITTGRAQRTNVAFLVSQANLQAVGAEVNLFLADQAAILAVKKECWPAEGTTDHDTLSCLQQGGGSCPPLPSLQSLLDQGAEAFGCPLCVNEVVQDTCGPIFNPDGTVNEDAWADVIFGGIQPIAPFDFELLYDRYTKWPLCRIDASVISF